MNSKYHTYESHIKPMLDFIDNELHLHSKEKIKILKLAAIFHDCIYVAGSYTNEDDSVNLFKDFYNNNYESNSEIIEKSMHYLKDVPINDGEYNKVIELIENTKNPFDMRYGDELGHIFAKLDIYVLTQDFYSLLIYEHRIYNEFKNVYTMSEYKSGRVDFLKKIFAEMPCVNTNGINQLISYVENRNYGTLGIFVGSFNPFHTGHYNVLEQARKDFDSIIIVQMQDFAKPKSIYEMPNLEEKVIKSDKTLVHIFNEVNYHHLKMMAS